MPLPKIMQPLFGFMIPSTGKQIQIRAMLSKEEKILLMARESQDTTDIFRAIRQVCNNCIMSEGFDIDSLAIFDLELLFLKLRSLSVSNIQKISYTDPEDEKKYDFEIDLEKITIAQTPDFDIGSLKTVKIDDDYTIILSYPSAKLYHSDEFLKATGDTVITDLLIKDCIKQIQTKTTVTPFNEGNDAEQQEFIDNLPVKARQDIVKFLNNLPKVYYKIEYTNAKGTERKIELQSLNDFFTLY